MIEQSVIEKLNPLKSEDLIILADPQRMIRAGARAVDGWAKENGFTVLFCSGNLALGKCPRTCETTRPPSSSWSIAPVTRQGCPSSTRIWKPAANRGRSLRHLGGLPDREDR